MPGIYSHYLLIVNAQSLKLIMPMLDAQLFFKPQPIIHREHSLSVMSNDESRPQIINVLHGKCLLFLSSFTQTRNLSTQSGKNKKYDISQKFLM
jgi:hypothetical protein